VLVVVLVGMASDVLVVAVVEDVGPGLTRPKLVFVVGLGRCAGLVVLGPLVVVVTVTHGTMRGVARQRSTIFVGAAPGSTAMCSRRVLPTETVNVPAWHGDVSHTGISNVQTLSHWPSTSQDTAVRPEPSVRCTIRPWRQDRRIVRAEASPAVTAAAATVSITSTRTEAPAIAPSLQHWWYHLARRSATGSVR
jgi:hypothetical protein